MFQQSTQKFLPLRLFATAFYLHEYNRFMADESIYPHFIYFFSLVAFQLCSVNRTVHFAFLKLTLQVP